MMFPLNLLTFWLHPFQFVRRRPSALLPVKSPLAEGLQQSQSAASSGRKTSPVCFIVALYMLLYCIYCPPVTVHEHNSKIVLYMHTVQIQRNMSTTSTSFSNISFILWVG